MRAHDEIAPILAVRMGAIHGLVFLGIGVAGADTGGSEPELPY